MRNIRKDIERLYDCKADVYEFSKFKNPDTRITEDREVLKHENIACRISRIKTSQLNKDNKIPTTEFTSKLFCSNEIEIKEGSKIVISKNHKKISFISGVSMSYSYHQEVPLKLLKKAGEV